MKKQADRYARATIARTGVLNVNKLHSYKYNDDLFLKKNIMPNGKDHGMVFFLDWSGSMADNMHGTMQQLNNLALFCKKAQIPLLMLSVLNISKENLVEMVFRLHNHTICMKHISVTVHCFSCSMRKCQPLNLMMQ